MKKNIHPKRNQVNFILPNGDSLVTHSTLQSKDGRKKEDNAPLEYRVDVLYLDCPAWNDGSFAKANEKASQVADFKRKYGDIFGDSA